MQAERGTISFIRRKGSYRAARSIARRASTARTRPSSNLHPVPLKLSRRKTKPPAYRAIGNGWKDTST